MAPRRHRPRRGALHPDPGRARRPAPRRRDLRPRVLRQPGQAADKSALARGQCEVDGHTAARRPRAREAVAHGEVCLVRRA